MLEYKILTDKEQSSKEEFLLLLQNLKFMIYLAIWTGSAQSNINVYVSFKIERWITT